MANDLSPMMQQYFKIKEQYPDTILFFRLGDFYEMFFDDAKLVSRELELTLTGRDCGLSERAPMCGVPFHSYETYLARLVSRGYKVAICEQMEDPATAKGLVKRDIIRWSRRAPSWKTACWKRGKITTCAACMAPGSRRASVWRIFPRGSQSHGSERRRFGRSHL